MNPSFPPRRLLHPGLAIASASLLPDGSAGAQAATLPAANKRRPNILFIAIEDVSPQRFGCYGSAVGRTPHLDRFAAGALRFANAHSAGASCCPSRTAMLTGIRPETSGVLGNPVTPRTRAIAERFVGAQPTLVEEFRKAGYKTVRIGKIGHPERPEAWTEVLDEKRAAAAHAIGKSMLTGRGPGVVHGQRLGVDETKEEESALFIYGPSGLDDLDHDDGQIAELGIGVLQAEQDVPLFLALGFHKPHLALRAPQAYFDLFPPDRMTLPHNAGADADGLPLPETQEALEKLNPWNTYSEQNPRTLQEWREASSAYHACLAFTDAQIGRVLDALEASGQADNTIVVVWSDHGFSLGENYRWRKGRLTAMNTRSVLMMRAPGVTRSGSVCHRPVESVDLLPTLLDLCGLPPSSQVEAVSLRPLLEAPERRWKKGALMTGSLAFGFGGGKCRGIVTERWRYSEPLKEGAEAPELFDLKNDPDEMRDVASDPANAGVIEELRRLVRGGWRECLPET